MNVIFLGAALREGISAKTGKPYSIGEIHYAVPMKGSEKLDSENKRVWLYTCLGYRSVKLDMTAEGMASCQGVTPLSTVELVLVPTEYDPLKNQCAGIISGESK